MSVADSQPLYTAAQRRRRDATRWTIVQGVLAPIQFAAFAVSVVLVLHTLATGTGYAAATASILVKTALLALIMATGAAWERVVFGRWLFARAFWWEDLGSMVVVALHAAYCAALVTGALGPRALLLLALAAYATYLVNAAQYVIKFRRARLDLVPAAPVPA